MQPPPLPQVGKHCCSTHPTSSLSGSYPLWLPVVCRMNPSFSLAWRAADLASQPTPAPVPSLLPSTPTCTHSPSDAPHRLLSATLLTLGAPSHLQAGAHAIPPACPWQPGNFFDLATSSVPGLSRQRGPQCGTHCCIMAQEVPESGCCCPGARQPPLEASPSMPFAWLQMLSGTHPPTSHSVLSERPAYPTPPPSKMEGP